MWSKLAFIMSNTLATANSITGNTFHLLSSPEWCSAPCPGCLQTELELVSQIPNCPALWSPAPSGAPDSHMTQRYLNTTTQSLKKTSHSKYTCCICIVYVYTCILCIVYIYCIHILYTYTVYIYCIHILYTCCILCTVYMAQIFDSS